MGVEDLYQRKYTDQKLAQKCGVYSKQSLNPGYVVNLLPNKENSKLCWKLRIQKMNHLEFEKFDPVFHNLGC